MKPIAEKFVNIPHSAIRKIFDMCIGVDGLISFAVGEPDFNTPKRIVDAAYQAMCEGKTRYTSNRGVLELRQSIAKNMKERRNIEVDPETEIIVTNGGMQALYMAMSVLLDPADEIIIGAPYFTNYQGQALSVGAVPKYVSLKEENRFVFKVEDLEKVVTEKTKAILINFPSNPLGSCMTKEELLKLSTFIIEKDLYVISDEVYKDYLYDEGNEFISIASMPGMKERTIIVDSFSKAYAMTGFRVGYAVANAEIIDQMVKLTESIISSVNTPAQYAAIEALTGPQADLQEMINVFKERRSLVYDKIHNIEKLSCIIPKGAFYFFINISQTGLSSEEFAIKLLHEEKVAVIPGSGFGEKDGEGYVRLSYVKSEADLQEGLNRIKRFVENL